MEKQKLKEIILLLCQMTNGDFYVPALHLKNMDPTFTSDVEFDYFLSDIIEQIFAQHKNNNDTTLIYDSLREILFDGKGYFVPCYGCYVNQKTENQINNDVMMVKGELIHYYNYARDLSFIYFCKDVIENKDRLSKWITERKNRIGQIINELKIEYSEDTKTKLIKYEQKNRKN